MNLSGIEWTQFTSNPVRGKCPHFGTDICGTYCYAHRIREKQLQWATPEGRAEADKLHFHPEVLQQIARRGKLSVIFMGSMIDLWADAVPAEWLEKILAQCRLSRQHTFLFLTKNPKRYFEFEFPANCWRGTTVTDPHGQFFYGPRAFVSIEPLIMRFGDGGPCSIEHGRAPQRITLGMRRAEKKA